MVDFKAHAPAEWNAHWASMPNSVDALYGLFWFWPLPFIIVERRIEAWGQLCFDDAANNAIAFFMYNHGMRHGWRYLSWRCEMSSTPAHGGKLSGKAPKNFNIYDYVPRD